MRRLLIPFAAGLACALFVPSSPRRAAAAPSESWPGLSTNNQWVMVEAEPMMDHPGGAAEVLEVCQRAKLAGYNGLMLWDSNLWDRQLPDSYLENAQALKAGLHQMGFTLMVEMCPRGIAVARWSGDETMCEPRPLNPHPDEKDYRYLCLSHPGVIPIWEEQLKRAEEIYHPLGWLLQYDELRVAATDARCKMSGKTPGQLLAEHARKAIAMCRRVAPGKLVSIWTDMFDPAFNANTTYQKKYHVGGTFAGSGAAIDKDVLLMQWNDKPVSFGYWAKRGNKQMVPLYFDHEISPAQEAGLMRVAKRTPGMVGWMYSTWKRQYLELEAYGTQYGGRGPRAALRGEKQASLPHLFNLAP